MWHQWLALPLVIGGIGMVWCLYTGRYRWMYVWIAVCLLAKLLGADRL
jgi:hypothetical protein